MVSVIQVYNALKDLVNKEQKGFITPQVFNSFAPVAQMNIYNELFAELVNAKRLSRQGFDPGRDKSVRKQRLEDLSYFIRTKQFGSEDIVAFGAIDSLQYTGGTIPSSVSEEGFVDYTGNEFLTTLPTASDSFKLPPNFSKLISVSVTSFANTDAQYYFDRTNCEIIYSPEDLDRIVMSNLSAPTEMFPVAYLSANKIELFPEGVANEARMTYYARPSSYDSNGNVNDLQPYFSFNEANVDGTTITLPNIDLTRDFMLPPHYLGEVVMEMGKLIGVRLRDSGVSAFTTQEEASE
jgi:hypothetical protein